MLPPCPPCSDPHASVRGRASAVSRHNAVCMQILPRALDSLEDAWCDTIRVAKAMCTVLNIQSMSNSYRGQGESLVPLYTRESVSLSSIAPLHPRAAPPAALYLADIAANSSPLCSCVSQN
jgi:hypothetical protein